MSDGDQYDAYTDAARAAISVAQDEALHLRHNYVGTEHVLLGLLRSDETVAAIVLRDLGVDLERTQRAIERIVGTGADAVSGKPELTPRTRRLLHLAEQEAHLLHAPLVGTEHLLLGLVREGEGIGVTVLANLGIDARQVREATYRVLGLPPLTTAETPADVRGPLASGGPARGGGRFDKFTQHARNVLSLAQEEAQRLQHNYVGTEHLLLGLVRMQSGVALHVLRRLGVEPGAIRAEVERLLAVSGDGERHEVGLTPRAKLVIELAVEEARDFGHHHIGSEHLLLGMIREPQGIASRALASLGVALEPARAETLRIVGEWRDLQGE